MTRPAEEEYLNEFYETERTIASLHDDLRTAREEIERMARGFKEKTDMLSQNRQFTASLRSVSGDGTQQPMMQQSAAIPPANHVIHQNYNDANLTLSSNADALLNLKLNFLDMLEHKARTLYDAINTNDNAEMRATGTIRAP